MRSVRELLLTIAITALSAPGALAQTQMEGPTFQSEALTAVSTNPALAAERSRVRAVRQALPQAWAELLPQVTADASAIEQDSTEDEFLPAFTIREQPEYWLASVRSSTMLFGSGRVLASTRQARAQIASAVALYQDAVQNFALEFTQAYAETRFANESLAAQQESLANLEEQVRFARANQREGFLTRTDVAQAEARVAQARADVARARSRVTEAVQLYARVVGHPPGVLPPPPALEGLPENLDDAAAYAQDEHPALVAAAAEVAGANAGIDLAASGGRLRLFLESTNSTFDAIGSGNDFGQEFESTVSVRVFVPLFSGGANAARTRQQRYVRDAARYSLLDTQRRILQRLNVAWAERESARVRLEASQMRMEAADLASRGTRREQQFGQRSMIDVLNQEQERLSARVALAEAERDVVISDRVLAASIGIIAPLLGIDQAANPRRERRPAPVNLRSRAEAPPVSIVEPPDEHLDPVTAAPPRRDESPTPINHRSDVAPAVQQAEAMPSNAAESSQEHLDPVTIAAPRRERRPDPVTVDNDEWW